MSACKSVLRRAPVLVIGSAILLAACSPKAPPPDLVKTQRQVLEQSKAVEGVLRKQSEDQGRAIDDASR